LKPLCITKLELGNETNYFGDQKAPEKCGHCSVCLSGAVSFQSHKQLPALSSIDCDSLLQAFKPTMGAAMSVHNATKFLCGIHTPIFTRLKVRALPNFGQLEQYPFQEVKAWVAEQIN